MRLKEIKPGMAIHCKNNEEKKALLEEAERLGYRWSGSACLPTDKAIAINSGMTICFYDKNEWKYYKHITWSNTAEGAIEFSDLILPELTSEEVVPILTEICNRYNENEDCEGCPLNGLERIRNRNECPFTFKYYKQVIEICEQWKAKHEKKEPEIETEWFWQGRIFKINEDDWHCQINDGTVFYDTGCEYRESAEEYMEGELKEYCKTHEGKFIAVVDHVCRIKR